MSLIADAAQPLLVQGILGIQGRLDAISVPDAILSPRAAYDLDFDDAKQCVLFDFRDTDQIVAAVASDCCRLAGSAFQTISTITGDAFERNVLPWELVKLYYSAFYAGQTIIRLLGEGCSFLDSRHISRIDAFGRAIGKVPNFKIDAGLYRCALDSTASKLTCIRIAGGTHESFWSVFGEHIEMAARNVLIGPLVPSDAQAVFSQLESFSRLIRRHGSYNWLSVLRNDLQYRHFYSVWFPSSIGKADRKALSRLASQWKSDPMAINLDATRFGDLGEFVIACAFIVSVCKVLLVRIIERTNSQRSFLNYGPAPFME